MAFKRAPQTVTSAAFVLIAGALMPLVPHGALADDPVPPSPEAGYALAQKFCKGCHLIDDTPDATIPVGVPTFRAIANRPGQTGERIMSVLINPHPPMPDIHLTTEEMENIVAYLETLRTDKSQPPLLPPVPSPKQKHPEPS